MKKIIIRSLLIFVFAATAYIVRAQGDPPTDGDPEVPLDPGSWVLVAAGAGYGIKKWRDSKQKNNKAAGKEIAAFMKDDVNQDF